ncbi:MAG: type II toxin-antitoxin system RelE/ParE family toxin [Phycisphaerae bacterium]
MTHQIRFRPEAEQELADALDWYESQRLGLGDELVLCVEQALDRIVENPEHFPVVHGSIRRALMRRFPYGVHYVMQGDDIVVLAVFHARRDPQAWRERSGG